MNTLASPENIEKITKSTLEKISDSDSPFTVEEKNHILFLLAAGASKSTWLTDEGYELIYRLVPRVCVDIVIVDPDKGVLLTKRNIEPFKGTYALPGGMIKKGETAQDALSRIAEKELGAKISSITLIDHMDFPQDGTDDNSRFGKNGGHLHSISLVFLCDLDSEEITINTDEADDYVWTKDFSSDVHPIHGTMLEKNNIINS